MIQRLFIYGTLAPGRPDEHVLADVPGTWQPATVSGRLLQQGWGAELGYPAIVLDEHSPGVHGFVFHAETHVGGRRPGLTPARRTRRLAPASADPR